MMNLPLLFRVNIDVWVGIIVRGGGLESAVLGSGPSGSCLTVWDDLSSGRIFFEEPGIDEQIRR